MATTKESAMIESFKLDSKVTFGIVALLVLYRTLSVIKELKSVGFLPGLRCIFEPFTFLGALTPASYGNLGLNFQWSLRTTLYKKYGSDTISIVPYVWGSTKIWTSNLEVAKQVVSGGPGSSWIKPKEYSKALLLFGMNIAAAEGNEVWRRHRRIMGPAFNNKTYKLVWDESQRVYKDMIEKEGWVSKSIIEMPVVQKYTFKFALSIIARCGFGLPFSWDEPIVEKDGSMSLQESLRLVSENNLARTSAPKWFWKLPIQKYQIVDSAFKSLDTFMHAQVSRRKQEIRKEIIENGFADSAKNDVFSRLVLASESEGEKLPLDDQELIGNVFVVLFAGHETSGHTLAATLGFLGIYQEEQEAIYEQIMEVVGDGRDPNFEDYSSLYKVLAAFYEALRLIPAGSVMIRETTRDTTLSIPRSSDKEGATSLPILKNTIVCVDMVGVQYNPRYFTDPMEFRPSRWYAQETSDIADSFTAFSVGPRACIGRKFATTEAVCWLSMLLRDFKVEVIMEPGESKQQARDRVLQAQMVMTLAVKPVPIRLIRRTSITKA